ncbi:MAG: 3-methyl-2-oxobutanoate hydroxymethyltransferase [Deltaproteobacteria bacterium]|nr:3-methyl-2-oxobutanoate hydroxymethyltransferase [Deltaproteobacteria bacterium]
MSAALNKLTMVTCYDATFAKICADAECFDYLLVGDSLGMVISGESSTTKVGMKEILHHASAVARGLQSSKVLKKPTLVVDMPIHSYEDPDLALENAKLLVRAGADMVKVEGDVSDVVKKLRDYKIRVCGHIGLTPQSIQDYKVQGRSELEAERLLREAKNLEKAGVEILVLEMLPASLAKKITESIQIPTVGIGAGVECSGQVLVLYDLLGFNPDFKPKFLKTYLDGYSLIKIALQTYAADVQESRYPSDETSFK